MRRESRPDDIASDRALQGAKLAAVAVFAGALATLASLLAVAFVATVASEREPVIETTRLARHALSEPVADLLHPALGLPAPDAGDHSRAARIGAVTLVDVAPNVSSLDDELARQRSAAIAEGERLVVWLVVDECDACTAVADSLPSAELQSALGGVRFVRVNAAHFIVELSRLGAPVDAFPGFVLLGPEGIVRDYVHAGEWGADVPRNIAPVLKSFVEGTYSDRQAPWRGVLHEDETPI